jgi:hypothetical protein
MPKEATRSRESYKLSGKKSSDTQKKNWENKNEEDILAWSIKMKDSHNTESFKNKIRDINLKYRQGLSLEDKENQNKKRSNSCKLYWNTFTPEQRKEWIKTSLSHGAGWNKETIQKTNIEKYGVINQFLRSDFNYHHKDSRPNILFNELLIENNILDFDREFPILNRAYDFKVGNNLIEINPSATHNCTWSPFNNCIDKYYHFNKSKLARDNGYRCIHVFDWDNIDKILQLLKPRKRIYARNCEVKKVSLNNARDYLNEYHLQGYAKDSIRLGLYYKNELVSIMTFDKPRYNKNYEFELIRYCSSYQVVGGAEKLFTHFIKTYAPKNIISYCDYSKFTGDIYEKLGFSFKKVQVGKHWYNINTNVHITDNLLRQRGFDQLFSTNYGKGTSNEELMKQNGFVEIFDAGQAVYTYN